MGLWRMASRSVVVAGCGFVDVGLWVWDCGGGVVEVLSVGLWLCGEWPVRAWQCLVVGLLGWGCGFGIVEEGL